MVIKEKIQNDLQPVSSSFTSKKERLQHIRAECQKLYLNKKNNNADIPDSGKKSTIAICVPEGKIITDDYEDLPHTHASYMCL